MKRETEPVGQPISKALGDDDDYYAWADDQARLLRNRMVHEADLDNIAEELEGWSRSERRGFESSLRLIILHMLKLQHQSFKATQSWRNTIHRERLRVEDVLSDSPSLRSQLPALFEKAYADGRRLAIAETGLPPAVFPEHQEFTLDQVVATDFIPNADVYPSPVLIGTSLSPPTAISLTKLHRPDNEES